MQVQDVASPWCDGSGSCVLAAAAAASVIVAVRTVVSSRKGSE